MDILELIAVICGIGSVFFSTRRHVLTYPVGLISVLLYVWLCFKAGLYGDMSVNVFFAVLSISGWIEWYRASNDEYLVVPKHLLPEELKKYGILTMVSFILVYAVLALCTNSSVPLFDSIVTTGSITGMLLMNKQKIEHWLVWIVVNTISMPLFWIKGLPLTTVQFFVLLVFSIYGYRGWKKRINHL